MTQSDIDLAINLMEKTQECLRKDGENDHSIVRNSSAIDMKAKVLNLMRNLMRNSKTIDRKEALNEALRHGIDAHTFESILVEYAKSCILSYSEEQIFLN